MKFPARAAYRARPLISAVATQLAALTAENDRAGWSFPVALAAAKRSLNAAPLASIEEIAELEAYGQAQAMASDDHREGRAAFAEKRTARFTGT